MSDAEDEESRKQREINWFSAYASGDAPSGTFDSSSLANTKDEPKQGSASNHDEPASQGGESDDQAQKERDMFSMAAAAAGDAPSGTVSFVASTKTSHVSSNLEAAAAKLYQDDDDSDDGGRKKAVATSPQISIPLAQAVAMQQNGNVNKGNRFENEAQMTSQKVRLARPLFFGSVLPPRVLRQAKGIISQGIDELRATGSEAVRVSSLKPDVRNLVGALRLYGHGIPLLPDELALGDAQSRHCNETIDDGKGEDKGGGQTQSGNGNANGKENPWQGSPYVTVYAPKWSDSAATWQGSADRDAGMGEAQTQQGVSSTPHDAENDQNVQNDGNLSSPETQKQQQQPRQYQNQQRMISPLHSNAPPLAFGREMDDESNSQAGLSDGSSRSSDSSTSPEQRPRSALQDSFNSWVPISVKESSTGTEDSSPMSEIDYFSQMARGESPSNSSVRLGSSSFHFSDARRESLDGSMRNSGTFHAISAAAHDDSDDDSVVGSELKKKVGVNEHLNAGLASLQKSLEQQSGDDPAESAMVVGPDDAVESLNQLPLTKDGGRPLSNLELMNGSTPLFCVDDPPLPVDSDLGNFETKDEQQRAEEQRRTQAIIEKFCPQNLFGAIACPTPAASPEDNQSWNKRAALPQHFDPRTLRNPTSPQPPSSTTSRDAHRSPNVNARSASSPPSLPPRSSQSSRQVSQQRHDGGVRHGWWNTPTEEDAASGVLEQNQDQEALSDGTPGDDMANDLEVVQLPPMFHPSSYPQTQTGLSPTPETLRNQNRPLSHLHPATSIAQTMPYLSDRSPSFRHLQIDTQALGFPPLGGEIEPLFCSLAVYHVKTTMAVGEPGAIPLPDPTKCGRITETLQFDVVGDAVVENACKASLWPYSFAQNADVASSDAADSFRGTRCGVFPIPSQLKIENLYAVIIVHKVIAESSDFEPYLRPGRSLGSYDRGTRGERTELDIFRSRSQKAASRQGRFLMPFAFGVTPLIQVFGPENPTVAISKAVQIPLLRFAAGLGERQIIDHIMVMRHPRADHRSFGIGGPAPVTNGGTAMLVMRNFGYLGLHTAINSKSQLARDRLVDFTGELQVRRGHENEQHDEANGDASNGGKTNPAQVQAKNTNTTINTSPYITDAYVAEPTRFGGRTIAPHDDLMQDTMQDAEVARTNSGLYAQELAPIPLVVAPPAKRTGIADSPARSRQRNRMQGMAEGSEPFYHTAFCNELLCNPRILHNCPKANTVIKVELRELEWSQEFSSYLAYLPQSGPSIHNSRRGPFLVQEAFTSCSSRCVDPQFLDEFKMKLPLELTPLRKRDGRSFFYAIFLSVFRVSFSSRKKWVRMLRPKRPSKKIDDIAGELAGETPDMADSAKSCRLIQLCCGFVPLCHQQAVVANGVHTVRLSYSCRNMKKDMYDSGRFEPGTLIVSEMDSTRADDATAEEKDSESVGSGHPPTETNSIASASDSHSVSEVSDDWRMLQMRQKPGHDPMTAQVKITVHSSLHPQNATLSEFFNQEPDRPLSVAKYNEPMLALLRMGRPEIMSQIRRSELNGLASTEYESERLLLSTVDISKSSMCPASVVSDHLLRVILHLLKIMVIGTGEPDLVWSNPASSTPLRIHSFATLLQLLGTSTLHLSKRGLAQLDGHKRWSIISLSRIAALLFDEGTLFGEHAKECKMDKSTQELRAKKHGNRSAMGEMGMGMGTNASRSANPLTANPLKSPIKTAPADQNKEKRIKRRRHVRSNFEIYNSLSQISTSGEMDDFLLGLKATQHDNAASGMDSGNGDFRSRSKTMPNLSNPQDSARSMLHTPTVSRDESPQRSQKSADTADATSKNDKSSLKIDSMTDFRTALHLGTMDDSNDIVSHSKSNVDAAHAMVKAFSGPQFGSRRWITAPSPSLATIREDAFDDIDDKRGAAQNRNLKPSSVSGPLDSLDTELIRRPNGKAVKQMRVPKLQKSTTPDSASQDAVSEASASSEKTSYDENPRSDRPGYGSYEEMESSGTAFLDVIGKSLGIRDIDRRGRSGEQERVGKANHRKTHSRSSIDWSIPGDDLSAALHDLVNDNFEKVSNDPPKELDEDMVFLAKEKEASSMLPNYVDRLIALGQSRDGEGRWFPYMYEVIIMQWNAVLREQESARKTVNDSGEYTSGPESRSTIIAEAAARSVGVSVACAPVLFEIIKQSIGWRIHAMEREDMSSQSTPLVTLDSVMMASLEQIISMVTDSCLDSRNFDFRETRDTCRDVNNCMIWFLRDMFAFLEPQSAYRLVLTYMSRFVTKDRANGMDRDSLIGSRCSWEITRLQMDAITALVRFPDFVKVNSPQMMSWGDLSTEDSLRSTTRFFDQVLEQFETYALPDYIPSDRGSQRHATSEIPTMRPHWLAELVADVCLLGAEHAEQDIRQRATSLLHEMFWTQCLQYMRKGNASVVASLHITFIEKVLVRVHYLSNFPPKNQLRKDIMPCVLFILQSSPKGLLRALWRKLFSHGTSKGLQEKYGTSGRASFGDPIDDAGYRDSKVPGRRTSDSKSSSDIFDMFCLLNLALGTFEYEGSDSSVEHSSDMSDNNMLSLWRIEFIMSREHETTDILRRRKMLSSYRISMDGDQPTQQDDDYASSSSRKWHAHDGNLIVVNTVQHIVRELRYVLEPSEEGQFIFNPARRKARASKRHQSQASYASTASATNGLNSIRFTYDDTVIFVRAATSVYLQALALRVSDIVLIRSLNAAVEVIKIFGIKIFNEAVGETLQHWMRLITFHCGARRAEVRVPAADCLELILRSTWDSFGSFFRIRLPLLAVQIEVMQRIVATSASRHYRDQRRLGSKVEIFSTGSAEASLAPLWRTFDRLHQQSASQNVAFRSALIRLAEKMKKLFRAYIAAHALWFLTKSRAPIEDNEQEVVDADGMDRKSHVMAQAFAHANRISIHRVINASAGYSKQFLGFYSTSLEHIRVAHYEAIEDAFLDAADVFSPTELPNHRMAWLRKLAEFHASRIKYAEEATCHFHIYLTLKQASALHGALWSSTPFLPWTESSSDGIQIDSEGPADDASEYPSSVNDLSESRYGSQIDQSNSFRRIFYRVANSIGRNGGTWENGSNKNLFFGVTLPSEYHTVSPWIKVREMAATMLEEAEAAGDLFLKAGVVESSRYLWTLATQHYAEKFNYWKLAHVYERLAQTVVSQVPPIDSSMQQEICLTVPLGRFYRVWFHGGAPDELISTEFVYRTASKVKLDQFGDELREIVRCIIPDKTPIHLSLDGRPDEGTNANLAGMNRMAPGATLEPVRIKVTPLRPLVVNATRIRGMPEWFNNYVDSAFASANAGNHGFESFGDRLRRQHSGSQEDSRRSRGQDYRHHTRTYSASVFSSGNSSGGGSGVLASATASRSGNTSRRLHSGSIVGDELVGADKFTFSQLINKDRSRGSRDWLRGSSGDYAEKSLRVTQLQVGQTFPACVARQAVIDRVVRIQSPLEAGIDSVCQWCTILFRTIIATNGQAVLAAKHDPGIGTDVARVVADCLHSSRMTEIGAMLLTKATNVTEEDDDGIQLLERLSDDEVKRFQLKLARSMVVFVELLHLLIARNRDMLLDVIQTRKKSDGAASIHKSLKRSVSRPETSSSRPPDVPSHRRYRSRARSFGTVDMAQIQSESGRPSDDTISHSATHVATNEESHSVAESTGTDKDRTDAAIRLQSELQRSFISLCKALYPMILGIMGPSETPRWLKQCSLDNYFSSYTYRQTKIPIAEELCFFPSENNPIPVDGDKEYQQSLRTFRSHESGGGVTTSGPMTARSIEARIPDSPTGSLGSGSAVSRGSDAARSTKSYKSSRSTRREERLAQF